MVVLTILTAWLVKNQRASNPSRNSRHTDKPQPALLPLIAENVDKSLPRVLAHHYPLILSDRLSLLPESRGRLRDRRPRATIHHDFQALQRRRPCHATHLLRRVARCNTHRLIQPAHDAHRRPAHRIAHFVVAHVRRCARERTQPRPARERLRAEGPVHRAEAEAFERRGYSVL